MQIVNGEDARRNLERTEEVTVNKPVPRGKIYDNTGKTIVDNAPVDTITYTRQQNTKTSEMLEVAENLAKLIDKNDSKVTARDKKDFWMLINPEAAEKKITKEDKELFNEEKIDNKEVYKRQLDRITEKEYNSLTKEQLKVLAIYREMASAKALSPQIIKTKTVKSINGTPKVIEQVTESEVAIISEHLESLPGIDVTTDWNREYLFGDTLKSVMGKVSKEGLPLERIDYFLTRDYSRNDRVGESYIESAYEDVLHGQKEKIKNITDKAGNVIESLPISEGQRGKDLRLTINMDLQRAVENIIESELRAKRGRGDTYFLDRAFVVLMDPNTGAILTMAGKKFEDGELQDYALGTFTSSYTMGSVVKGATVLTGYQTGAIHPGKHWEDTPVKIAQTIKKSWTTMGWIDDLTALKRSSNVYMFRTAMEIGAPGRYSYGNSLRIDEEAFETMRYYYNQFGLGTRTGIDLPNEAVGFKGTDKRPGFLLDLSIGQYDMYTPMQLAQYVSTIANGGKRLKPHIVQEIREPSKDPTVLGPVIKDISPVVLNTLDMKSSWIDRVQTGFRQVMQESGGTAVGYFGPAKGVTYNPAGKTGTAEAFYDGPRRKEYEGEPPATMNLSLVAYAPANNPEVAMAVVVPWAYQGKTGHNMNLDIGKKVMDTYFSMKK